MLMKRSIINISVMYRYACKKRKMKKKNKIFNNDYDTDGYELKILLCRTQDSNYL